MGSDTKWADVAHYYTRSKLTVVHSSGTMQAAFFEFDGYALDAARVQVFRAGEYKPILRHRDDMTEAEARELFALIYGDFAPTLDGETCIEWWTRETLQDSFTMNSLNIFIGDPNVWHYLISHGFDLFGLIESGQAIRKEAGNG